MFHTSDIKKFTRCPKLFWLSLHRKKEPYLPYARMDEKIGELAKEKLEIKDCFQGRRNDDAALALDAMKNQEWILKGRFEAGTLRIKVPFLHRNGDVWDVYFLYSGHLPKENEAISYAHHIWVLEQNHIALGHVYVLHFNPDYVRGTELDAMQLFCISSHFYNDSGNPGKNVEKTIKERHTDLFPILAEMERIQDLPELEGKRSNACTRRSKCNFYGDCFEDIEMSQPDNSMLHLVSSQHKLEMFEEGKTSLSDIDLERLEGNRLQYAQIRAAQNGGLYVERWGLKSWMDDHFKYPLSFLDFEWDTYAIPPYAGMKSFDVLPFQYSLHILEENGSIKHREYIGRQDCREEFIKTLLQDIPSAGSIIAFNSEGAEKLRIQELAGQFDRYSERLLKLTPRMTDLSFPFSTGLVYDLRMRGLYSLKVLLSIFDDTLTYKALDISHGMDAVFQWRAWDRQEEEADEAMILKHLLEYCSLDTYAMIIVYRWLKKQLDQPVIDWPEEGGDSDAECSDT